jgi:hypothetical protein
VDLRQWRGLGGKIFTKARANLVRDRLPHGKFAHGFHVPEHVVEHLMGLPAEAAPILRIERRVCRRCKRMLVCRAGAAHSFAAFVFSQRDLPLQYMQLECQLAQETSDRARILVMRFLNGSSREEEELPINDVSEGM